MTRLRSCTRLASNPISSRSSAAPSAAVCARSARGLMRRRPRGVQHAAPDPARRGRPELVESHRGLVLLERADEAFGDISQFGKLHLAEAEAAPPRSHVLTRLMHPSSERSCRQSTRPRPIRPEAARSFRLGVEHTARANTGTIVPTRTPAAVVARNSARSCRSRQPFRRPVRPCRPQGPAPRGGCRRPAGAGTARTVRRWRHRRPLAVR